MSAGGLNSDDYYYENALHIAAKYFVKNDIDFLFESVWKNRIKSQYNPSKIRYSFDFYSAHSFGFFIKTAVQKDIGLYNLKYSYSADYDLFYRLIVHNSQYKGMKTEDEEMIGEFRVIGYSSEIPYLEHLCEETLIRINNG